ncbi:MAG: O-antigen ligase family protein [Armatimonadota bacterium]|nr:O-antigen ligase family protein [Armatimonadota bacterium]
MKPMYSSCKPLTSADRFAAVLLIAALALAPIVAGGLDELPNAAVEWLIFLAVAVELVRRKEAHFPRFAPLVALAVFCLLVLFSALFTENIYTTLKSVLYLLSCLFAYSLAGMLSRSRKIASAVVWTFVLVALGISLFGVRDYAIGTGGGGKFWRALLHGSEHWRLFGTFLNPGYFAGYLVVAIPVTLGVFLSSTRLIGCFVAGTGLVMEVSALLLTGTKLAVLALVVAMLMMLADITILKKLTRSQLLRCALILVVLVPCFVLFSAPLTERVKEAGAGGTQVHSTRFRIYVWRSALQMIRENPVVGLGPGTFEVAYPRYAIAGPTKHAHQSYLQVGAEAGVPALLALLAAVVLVFRDYLRVFRRERGVSGGAPVADNGSRLPLEEWYIFPDWGLLNCTLFYAFVGSCVRNLADSDWFLLGIALPLAVLVGVLSARSARETPVMRIAGVAKVVLIALTAAAIVLSISIGVGDYLAPDEELRSYDERDVQTEYRRYGQAVLANPLNPGFRREYAKCIVLAQGDQDTAERQLAVAIRIAPTDAANYFTRGLLALFANQPKEAIIWFRKALRYNPNSTQILQQLALCYQRLNDVRSYERVLRRLIRIENSDYERIRGVPELVDLTYVHAHMYFGDKFLAARKFSRAVNEYKAVVDRIENWRSQTKILQMQRALGMLTQRQKKTILQALRGAYLRLSEAYQLSGQPQLAESARHKAESLNIR